VMEAQLRNLTDERADLTSRLEASASEIEGLREACAERDRRISVLESRLREIDTARAKAETRIAASNTESANLEKKYEELLVSSERDRRQSAEEIASLTRQISQLRARYDHQISDLSHELERRVEWPGEREHPPSGSNGNQASSRVEVLSEVVDDAPTLLIVDDTEVGQDTDRRLAKFGFPTLTLKTDSALDKQIGNRHVVCMALNLAAPSSWRSLRMLRNSTPTAQVPIVAYVIAPRAETGYWFGHVDFIPLPLEYNDLIASLRSLTPLLKHVILIGMDEKLAGRVRKHLDPAGITVTSAIDRRNALEAVRGKYPQAAVVYPAQNPVDGFRAIAGIRSLAIFKDLPTVFLLTAAAVEREDERLSAGARNLLRLGSLKPAELVDLLASAMNKFNTAGRNGE